MTEKELKNKDSVKEIAPILLLAPVVLNGYGEEEQCESKPGVGSGADFTEDAPEDSGITMSYAQCP